MAKKLTPEERESLKIQIRIARRKATEQAKSKAKAKRRPVVAGFRDPVWIRYGQIEDMVPLRDCYHGINCPHVERWERDGYMYRIVELGDVLCATCSTSGRTSDGGRRCPLRGAALATGGDDAAARLRR